MDISRFLSRVLGIYLIVLCAAILINRETFVANVIMFTQDPPVVFITGFFTLVIGTLMIVSHNIWRFDWRVLITIISWLAFIKGVVIVISPIHIARFTNYFIFNSTYIYAACAGYIILAIIFCYKGFFSTKN